MKDITLTWGMPHSLVVREYGGANACMMATMYVVKPNGTQEISFVPPPGSTLEGIEKAWDAQGKQWIPLAEIKGQPFVAVRGFQLPDGWAIVWHVYHLNDVPVDAIGVVKFDMTNAPRAS